MSLEAHATAVAPQSLDERLALVRRCLAGTQLAEGFELWVSKCRKGTVEPLQMYLGLPHTPGEWGRVQRDAWLLRASVLVKEQASLAPTAGLWTVATVLQKRWCVFLDRGPWRFWRDRDLAPPDADALSVSLFNASKFGRGKRLSVRSVYRTLGGDDCIFSEIFVNEDRGGLMASDLTAEPSKCQRPPMHRATLPSITLKS